MINKRGRPKLDNPLKNISMRIDADRVAYYRGTGKVWMTRMRHDLRDAAIRKGVPDDRK